METVNLGVCSTLASHLLLSQSPVDLGFQKKTERPLAQINHSENSSGQFCPQLTGSLFKTGMHFGYAQLLASSVFEVPIIIFSG